MKIFLSTVVLILSFNIGYCDSIPIKGRVDDLERTVKQIDANQLNYKIEKDLLKETYSNNYDRIQIFLTVVLALGGIAGFLGLKNVNEIKDKYLLELEQLSALRDKFNEKTVEYDKSLEKIIQENKKQNSKIQLLELKEKAESKFAEQEYRVSLDIATAGLEIEPNDARLLNVKYMSLGRLNYLQEAIDVLLEATKKNPDNKILTCGLIECYFFVGRSKEAHKLIKINEEIFSTGDRMKVLELFDIVDLFHAGNLTEMKNIAQSYVTFSTLEKKGKRVENWDLVDLHMFAQYQTHGELKTCLENLIWFWQGTLTGRELLTNLSLPIPTQPPFTNPNVT